MGNWRFGCLSTPLGFTCWISFALVFSFIYCWVLIFALSPYYILIYMFWRHCIETSGGLHANQISVCFDPHLNKGWGWRHETSISPQVKYFTDRSKAVLLLWMFNVFSILCLLCLCARMFICVLWSPAGKGLVSLLSFVVSNCEFVTFPLVPWIRCGTWLYRFLTFAPLLPLHENRRM